MRELTLAELELISGGSSTTEVDGIVVVADGGGGGDWGDWGDWGDGGDWGDQGDHGDGGGGGDSQPPPPTDESSVDVDVDIQRPLTAEEQKAVDDFEAAVADVTDAINNIPDNAVLTLSNGDTVTGAELKALWAKTDFTINEVGTSYANNTTRGEADLNGGDPEISLNIDVLTQYNAWEGGVEYLVLHELAHVTSAGQQVYGGAFSEQVANDIAHGIAGAGGLPIISTPGHDHSGSTPPTFVTPPPPSGGGGGGGGGLPPPGGGAGGGGGFEYNIP